MVVTPEGGAPLALAVQELGGVSGDDYTVKVNVPGAAGGDAGSSSAGVPIELVLSRLGHDGPTLAESLRREWLLARTESLRLGGSGEGWLVLGQVTGLGKGVLGPGGGPEAEPFRALLFEDVLVVACEGRDLEPVFLALTGPAEFHDATYTVDMEEWPGRRLTFSKLAKQTDEFLKRLSGNRALLAKEAAATLAAAAPAHPVDSRAALAGSWLPGRLLCLSTMEGVCPGFEKVFRDGWLSNLLRREEGAHLLQWASSGGTWLGCTREAEADATGGAPDEVARPLWMLAGKKGVWFLEALSLEDRATYCFKGGEEVPALVSRLLCAPQFSKEALYAPLEELSGDKADLAIPARYLGFLVELRTRFKDRVIHQSVEGWRKDFEGLAR